jgi:hypothetical protein
MTITISILLGILVINLLLMIKNQNAYLQRDKIIDAIYEYNHNLIMNDNADKVVSYDSIEPYVKTWLHLGDWGCTNIVPPDVYEKIKPYIETKCK